MASAQSPAPSPLRSIIADRIRSRGTLSFEEFMELALYHPGLGYYARPGVVIGRQGDFYTSSHLHRLFGALLGRQIEECWEALGMPGVFDVVEAGAGMGHLAKDMLDYLAGRPCRLSLRYTIIERNPAAAERQRDILGAHSPAVRWRDDLRGAGPIAGCIISNELIDAFPVRLVEMAEGLHEIRVGLASDERFVEERVPADPEIHEYFALCGVRPSSVMNAGYRTEVNMRAKEWLGQAADAMAKGFIITIDYGYPASLYYSKERTRGTLLCYYGHQVSEDPYERVGEQDITAHVNFTSLRKWGEGLGLAALGFCPQGIYLASLGLDDLLAEGFAEEMDPFELARVKTLLLPQGMGESHKVFVQYKGEGRPLLRGFSFRNDVDRL